MFNYIIKSTIRHLTKQKWFTIYSIIGFSIGFISLLIIFLFVEEEQSYDSFHENSESIFRLEDEWIIGGEKQHSAATNAYLIPSLLEDCPEVTSGVRLVKSNWTAIIKFEENNFPEDEFCFVDSTFFNFFTFKLIHGTPLDVLNSPQKVVLSKSTAIKYFGTDNVVGKQITYQFNTFMVSGVYDDMPEQSHFHFDLIFNIEFLMNKRFNDKDKADNVFYSYIMVNDKAGMTQLREKLNANIKNIYGYKQKLTDSNITCNIKFQHLEDIHLHGNAEREIEKNGQATLVSILKLLSILILIIASINYANMAIAKSVSRANEIGITKVFGARKKIVFLQFMTESFLLVFASVLVATVLVLTLLPGFNFLFSTQLEPLNLISPSLVSIIIVSLILVSFISGIYPAIHLANLMPLRAIKLGEGSFSFINKGIPIRKTFMIAQLTISVFFITSIVVINKQYNYLQKQSLGFDKDNVIVLPLKGIEVRNRNVLSSFKQELLKSSNILNASVSDVVPGERFLFLTARFPNLLAKGELSPKEPDGSVWMRFMLCDEDIVQTLGLKIVEGRDFPKNSMGKELYMINETAVKQLGIQNPLEEPFEFTQLTNSPPKGKFIAVVKDFNFASLHSSIEPVIIRLSDLRRLNLIIRHNDIDSEVLISYLKNTWHKFYPNIPFDYYHLSERYKQLYSSEANMKKLFSIFTFIAILLSCMGLLGMSYFMLEQRKKEIGIRKVLGANIFLVMQLIFKEFLVLSIIANVLAWIPVTFFLNSWLQNFAYNEGINLSIYLFALVVSVLFTIATVSIHTYNAAISNPVKSIKSE